MEALLADSTEDEVDDALEELGALGCAMQGTTVTTDMPSQQTPGEMPAPNAGDAEAPSEVLCTGQSPRASAAVRPSDRSDGAAQPVEPEVAGQAAAAAATAGGSADSCGSPVPSAGTAAAAEAEEDDSEAIPNTTTSPSSPGSPEDAADDAASAALAATPAPERPAEAPAADGEVEAAEARAEEGAEVDSEVAEANAEAPADLAAAAEAALARDFGGQAAEAQGQEGAEVGPEVALEAAAEAPADGAAGAEAVPAHDLGEPAAEAQAGEGIASGRLASGAPEGTADREEVAGGAEAPPDREALAEVVPSSDVHRQAEEGIAGDDVASSDPAASPCATAAPAHRETGAKDAPNSGVCGQSADARAEEGAAVAGSAAPGAPEANAEEPADWVACDETVPARDPGGQVAEGQEGGSPGGGAISTPKGEVGREGAEAAAEVPEDGAAEATAEAAAPGDFRGAVQAEGDVSAAGTAGVPAAERNTAESEVEALADWEAGAEAAPSGEEQTDDGGEGGETDAPPSAHSGRGPPAASPPAAPAHCAEPASAAAEAQREEVRADRPPREDGGGEVHAAGDGASPAGEAAGSAAAEPALERLAAARGVDGEGAETACEPPMGADRVGETPADHGVESPSEAQVEDDIVASSAVGGQVAMLAKMEAGVGATSTVDVCEQAEEAHAEEDAANTAEGASDHEVAEGGMEAPARGGMGTEAAPSAGVSGRAEAEADKAIAMAVAAALARGHPGSAEDGELPAGEAQGRSAQPVAPLCSDAVQASSPCSEARELSARKRAAAPEHRQEPEADAAGARPDAPEAPASRPAKAARVASLTARVASALAYCIDGVASACDSVAAACGTCHGPEAARAELAQAEAAAAEAAAAEAAAPASEGSPGTPARECSGLQLGLWDESERTPGEAGAGPPGLPGSPQIAGKAQWMLEAEEIFGPIDSQTAAAVSGAAEGAPPAALDGAGLGLVPVAAAAAPPAKPAAAPSSAGAGLCLVPLGAAAAPAGGRGPTLVELPLAVYCADEPSGEGPQARRSSRVRVQTLQSWRSERVLYERLPGSTAPTVRGRLAAGDSAAQAQAGEEARALPQRPRGRRQARRCPGARAGGPGIARGDQVRLQPATHGAGRRQAGGAGPAGVSSEDAPGCGGGGRRGGGRRLPRGRNGLAHGQGRTQPQGQPGGHG
ncbi:unnamed protein product [Prorocentrum cordatum]|uniref:Uncharacterized protein n=1 Tax=Prorocentrum cordatum TaxID=2364126 RepID=A0ABN9URN4_9DINO|nr:unnamed protein product [Polarella glacialis]